VLFRVLKHLFLGAQKMHFSSTTRPMRFDVRIYVRTERVIVEKALAAAKVASVSLFKMASLS